MTSPAAVETERPPYTPTGPQVRFHRSPFLENLYGGAMGGGKSYALCEEALERAINVPDSVHVITRFTLQALKLTTMATFFDEVWPRIPKEWRDRTKYHSPDYTLTLWNNAQIIFMGCVSSQGHSNIDKIKSMNVTTVNIDEASRFPSLSTSSGSLGSVTSPRVGGTRLT